jgi:hypothetical protein
MEPSKIDPTGTWAPAACTLPAAERPQRAAGFDALFAGAVRGIERAGPTRLRLELQPSPQAAARAAELAAAETRCCSFFTFTLTAAAGRLVLDITVPAPHTGTLDLLAGHAAATAAGGTSVTHDESLLRPGGAAAP